MTGTSGAGDRRRRVRHRRCKVCGVSGTPQAPISSRGKCYPCGEALVAEAIRAMKSRQGAVWQRWGLGMVAAGREATGGRVVVVLDGGVSCKASHEVDTSTTMGSSHPAVVPLRAG